jgi:pimeloyl-ACP methyl ester carboxylesterase
MAANWCAAHRASGGGTTSRRDDDTPLPNKKSMRQRLAPRVTLRPCLSLPVVNLLLYVVLITSASPSGTLRMLPAPLLWPPAELADNSSCAAAGVDPARYMARLEVPNRYNSTHGDTIFAPIYTSLPFTIRGTDGTAQPPATADAMITHAVILVHGLAGNANAYFCDGVAATAAAGVGESTLVIAPWFGSQQVTAAQWAPPASSVAAAAAARSSGTGTLSSSSSRSAYWDTSRWLEGGDNSPDPPRYTTSFDVIDLVVEALQLANTSRFPNLKQISLAGFSAGAQLVSRWSVFSAVGNTRTIIGDGSSYLYLDSRRPDPSCDALADTGINHTCASFSEPAVAVQAACPKWNQYKFGLGNLTAAAEDNMYIGRAPAAADLLRRFLSRDVRFVLGTEDVCNCNTAGYTNPKSLCYPAGTSCAPDATGGTVDGVNCCDTFPDTGSQNALATYCEAMPMGSNRLQRGLNYVDYLRLLRVQHGETPVTQSNDEWPALGFFQGGHDNRAFYASAAFRSWAFGVE